MYNDFAVEELSGFLRIKDVLKLIPVSKATWWNGCRDGKYPQPYKLGPRMTAWKVSEIKACMEKFKVSEYQN